MKFYLNPNENPVSPPYHTGLPGKHSNSASLHTYSYHVLSMLEVASVCCHCLVNNSPAFQSEVLCSDPAYTPDPVSPGRTPDVPSQKSVFHSVP